MATEFDADVIVVGSGACGSNLANELAVKGKSVILLEAGANVPRWKILENFRNSGRHYDRNNAYPNNPWSPTSNTPGYIENVGEFREQPGMLKLVGGTTWHWGGATWRYIPNDFKLKTMYGVGRDWPISYSDLEPFYTRAEYAIGVAGSDTEDQSGQNPGISFPPRSKAYPVDPEADIYSNAKLKAALLPHGHSVVHEPTVRIHRPYDGRPGCQGNNNCDQVCPIGTLYNGSVHADKAVRNGAKLITDAVVHKITKGEQGKITSVSYLTPAGEEHTLTAKYFVLAAHSFETSKLMLMNDIGNSSDMVGRNLMDHIGLSMNFLADEPMWAGRGPVQQATIMTWRDGDFRSKYSANKHSLANNNPQIDIAQRAINEGLMGKELDARILDWSSRWMSIYSFLEPLPNPANRVQPNPAWKDSLGLPGIKVTFDVDDYTKLGAKHMVEQYKQIAGLMNGQIIDLNTAFENHDHLMGTMIMGDNPKDSVVNHECRSHDHPNLFIASVGVIPAAGVVNPTLTGVALAIRSADIIAKEV
ncbi:GMC family oxidoreductase [Tatumella citrea]|mgnify:CR=1 FL=1|uniref:Choline dehydrogenase n=1 Tax=Tatumella citrea TaxID=53336 RepID=A0A1Y0L7G7_TATCI|nr:GMC family oxidoreductase [Tatumella citrea]ARU93963.1 choline dehydrogenase [Tatumella citrea]ARU98001.1 choline dehydrogenase [Tatumella citrea]